MGGAPPVSGGSGGSGGGGGEAGSPPLLPDAGLPTPPDGSPDTPPADAAVSGVGAWARGIRVGLVEIAQGVFIKLGQGDTVVAPASRNAELIEGRPAFVRVHVTTDPGFVGRPLRGVLRLEQAGGGPRELEETKPVSGPSNEPQLATTFNFLLPAEAMKPQARLEVAIYETAAAEGPDPLVPPRFPAMGTLDLDVKAGRMVLDVVMVPVIGPTGPLADTPERRKRVENHLYDVYAIQKLNIRWRAPVRVMERLSAADGFELLSETRTQDNARPNEYYHLLIAVESSTETYLGIANGAGATPNDGPRRIAMTFVRMHAIDSELDTISHEMGHNHGRGHPAGCNAGGVDTRFPYPMTGVGVSGYSLMDSAWKNGKTHKDLMGYCYPTWISDYSYMGFLRRVRAVSAFAGSGGMALSGRSLQGFHQRGQGTPRWSAVDGQLVEASLAPTRERQARITLDDGRVLVAPVAIQEMSQGGVHELAVNLPDEGTVAAVEVLVDGQSWSVPAADLL